MRERVYRTTALILRRSDLGEADRLLVISTPAGKRHVVARGVRKTTSRIAGHIELFTHTSMMLAVGRNLDVVTQSQVLDHFNTLRASLQRLSCAYYIAELYDALTQEEEHQQVFSLLVKTFQALDTTRNPDLVVHACELHLLHMVGYRPHLQRCAVCERLLTEESDRFSPVLGGVLCPQDAQADHHALPMSLNAFKLLRYLQREPLEAVERITISVAVHAEVENLLRAYVRHILERDLKSVTFIESLRGVVGSSNIPDGATATHELKELHHGLH